MEEDADERVKRGYGKKEGRKRYRAFESERERKKNDLSRRVWDNAASIADQGREGRKRNQIRLEMADLLRFPPPGAKRF